MVSDSDFHMEVDRLLFIPSLLAIVGPSNSGKSLAGKILEKERGYYHAEVSQPIRESLYLLDDGVRFWVDAHGWSDEFLRRDDTKRKMFRLGNAVSVHSGDFWLRASLKAAHPTADKIVVTGARRKEDLELLSNLQATYIWVERGGSQWLPIDQTLKDLQPHYSIANTGNLDKFTTQLIELVDNLSKGKKPNKPGPQPSF